MFRERCVMDREVALHPRRRRLFTLRELTVILIVSVAITTALTPLIG